MASDAVVSDPARARKLARASLRVSIAGIIIGVFFIILVAALGSGDDDEWGYVYVEPLYDTSVTQLQILPDRQTLL